jgi:hypothetical protein
MMMAEKKLRNGKNLKLHFVIRQKKLLPSNFVSGQSGLRFGTNLQINLEAKPMEKNII